jgi:hypothetical protein
VEGFKKVKVERSIQIDCLACTATESISEYCVLRHSSEFSPYHGRSAHPSNARLPRYCYIRRFNKARDIGSHDAVRASP